MTVKVLLKRYVPKSKEKDLLVLIKELRQMTTRQPGYVSGETLDRIDRPGQNLVISTWEGLEHWEKWFQSEERKRTQDKIDDLLGQKTEFKIYTHG